ncbi:hypothetical protein D3C81_1284210 [compost metagenome]
MIIHTCEFAVEVLACCRNLQGFLKCSLYSLVPAVAAFSSAGNAVYLFIVISDIRTVSKQFCSHWSVSFYHFGISCCASVNQVGSKSV